MKNVKIVPTTVLGGLVQVLVAAAAFSLSTGAQAHDSCPPDPNARHSASHPHCADGGDGGDGGQGSDIATNPITARWSGAVNGTTPPRDCYLEGDPQPQGTHTAYACEMNTDHTISVNLTGGEVMDTRGSPTAEDVAACAAGFQFADAWPNSQFIVGVSGEICTDADGCPLGVHTATVNQAVLPNNFVKLLGRGRVAQSENLNPFACPASGSPATQITAIETIEVRIRDGKGSKADLICLFDVSGTTSFEVTPVCP